jgi:CO/xanthine dehydrogenase FAD-binding subunit
MNDTVIPFAGGTDLMVRRRGWAGTLPTFEYPVLFLGGLEELKRIYLREDFLEIGAAASLVSILEHRATPEILKEAVAQMASPAIRNIGTLGGNICNASPAADTIPPLLALDASVTLQSLSGIREIPLDEFIIAPGQTSLKDDELLVAVHFPMADYNMAYYRKVGTRKADALSKVSFAGLARIRAGIAEEVRIAIGAVAPRVVRNKEAEGRMAGIDLNEIPSMVEDIKAIYDRDIWPIDDQRSSAVYRRKVSLRLIEDFLRQFFEEQSRGFKVE